MDREEFMLMEKSQENIKIERPLAILNENKRKIEQDDSLYYNEKHDIKDIAEYYKSIKNNLVGIGLYYKYHDLLKKTHKNQVPYFYSKDVYLYTWVDMQPDGSVKSIYSGETQDPETVILEDYLTINKRYEEFNLALRKTKRKNFEITESLRKIEWELKMNTEHIVPQSWFGGREPMKGDLHHLFVCQPRCNTSRANFPYADFIHYVPESPTEKIRNHCGLVREGFFEPEFGKGTAARAMLYFLLRYPKAIKRMYLANIHIPLLIEWDRNFPVTLYEKHRNQAIYHIQGNRNPFIDFHELSAKLDFPI